MDPRHQLRIRIIQQLYALTFTKSKEQAVDEKTQLIIDNLENINSLIKQHAPKYPLENIAKVDLAILQLAVYELVFEKKQPAKVIIDEAIELAKELGSEKSFGFVNAVLGKIYKQADV